MEHMRRVVDMFKKIFSSMMAVVLVVGLLPTVALADADDVTGNDTENIGEVDAAITDDMFVGTVDGEIFDNDELTVIDVPPFETQEVTSLSVTPLATYSGTLGTCTWKIDDDGCLTIAPANGVSGSFTMTNPSHNSWPWYSYRNSITSAKVEPGVSATGSLAYMFYYCSKLVSLDLSGFDTTSVTDMSHMFEDCASLLLLDISNFDTSNVIDMSEMFSYCSSLIDLDLTYFNTSKLMSMRRMFEGCSSLTSIDLSGLDTSQVTDMRFVFSYCSSLISLDLANFDTSNVIYVDDMFLECTSLTYLDISNFNTSKVEVLYKDSMFASCASLWFLSVGSEFSFTANDPYDGGHPIPVYNGIQGTWRDSNGTVYDSPSDLPNNVATTYTAVFEDAYPDIVDLKLTVTEAEALYDFQYTDASWANLQVVLNDAKEVLSNESATQDEVNAATAALKEAMATLVSSHVIKFWDIGADLSTDLVATLYDDGNFVVSGVGDAKQFHSIGQAPWRMYKSLITTLTFDESITVTNLDYWFTNCTNLITANELPNTLTSMVSSFSGCTSLYNLSDDFTIPAGVDNISYLFNGCSSLTNLSDDLTIPWGVTDMSYAFTGCSSLASLPKDFTIPSGMADISYAFQDCSSLASLPDGVTIPYGVTNMQGVFYGCSSLISLPEKFTIPSNATDLSYMFYGCSSLTESPTIPSSVTNISYTFYGCSSFIELPDLPSGTTNMDYAFYNCTSITTLPNGFRFPSRATTTYAFGVDDPYSRANPLETWCSEDDYEYLVDSYDWVSSSRKLGVATIADDKTKLESAISAANALDPANYTSDSWAVLEAALAAANEVLADDYATQGEVDAATSALQSAIDALVRAVDTSVLEKVIKTAESLNSGDYTESSWIVLQSTLTYAKNVLDTISSTQAEVDAATDALQSAIDALESADPGITVDKSALEAAISAAEKLDSSDYTESSWALLETVLTLAKSVLDNTSVTQEIIDSTTDALNSVIDALVPVSDPEPTPEPGDAADKTELEMTIKAAAQLDESEYTSDSWAALQDVLQAAQRIDADDMATQAEVYEVTDALLTAIDSLQKLFVDVTDPSTYYYEYVYYMAGLGIITGYNETTFGVGDPMTRAQLVTIMWRYCEPDEYANYNEATAKNTSGLPDVSDGMYYTGAVNWAVANNIVTGNQLADGSYVFSPDDNVSFEQMVTIVARYVLGFDGAEKYNTASLDNGSFTDAATVSNYARGSIAWAIENGVVTGNQNADGTYTIAPLEDVARERAATVLARAIQSELITAN